MAVDLVSFQTTIEAVRDLMNSNTATLLLLDGSKTVLEPAASPLSTNRSSWTRSTRSPFSTPPFAELVYVGFWVFPFTVRAGPHQPSRRLDNCPVEQLPEPQRVPQTLSNCLTRTRRTLCPGRSRHSVADDASMRSDCVVQMGS